ncbi:MAG: hypothetical protein EOO91_05610 [Pedobacter sp.]|nr:MAG: hypothetical protein EOO91_05610 [Pedobacter sp.]
MASLDGGVNGGFSGKAGSVVGYYMYGKWRIRGLPKLSAANKKGSTKQKLSRSRFTVMQHFLGPVLYFLRSGFNLASKENNNSAYNSAKSYNMLHAMDADGNIQYDKVVFSVGNLTGAEGVKVEEYDAGFHFTWDDNSNHSSSRKVTDARIDDQVMLLAYDVNGKRAEYITSGAKRATGRESLLLDQTYKGKEMHLWISFIADDRSQIATSTYLGSKVY